jgi:large subunit ribosomal protein L10
MKEATLNLKIENVNEVVSNMKDAKSIVIVNCIGLTVAETMDLRRQLYANGCSLKVVKNNILRRASKEMGYDELCDSFAGPSAIAYSPDANTAAKIIYGFDESEEHPSIKKIDPYYQLWYRRQKALPIFEAYLHSEIERFKLEQKLEEADDGND